MIQIKVNLTTLGKLGERLIKSIGFGASDVQTSDQIASHGIDSNPIKGLIAIKAGTSIAGETVVLGYINPDQIAESGEIHLFATDSDGVEKFRIKVKNDGTCEIGGDARNAAGFQELQMGHDELRDDHNTLVTLFNAHVHPGVTPGPGATLVTLTLASPSTASIDGAIVNEVKFP